MKSLILFLFMAIFTVHGYAKDMAVKQAEIAKKPHKHGHQTEKIGICANPATPPTSQCSETVTAAFGSKGELWIAWVNNEHLYVQSSLDKGVTFTAPVKVNAVAEPIKAKGEVRPKIKLDAQGTIYLTWVRSLDKKFSAYVRFSRSNDGGKHFSEPVTVNDNLAIIGHNFDSLAIGKNGEIFIAWLDARDAEAAKKAGQEFKGLALYYTWSDNGGQHFYPNKSIAAHTCECCRIDTAIDRDNTPVIAWRHIFAGGIRDHAIVKFKDWNNPGVMQHLGRDNWEIEGCPHHGPGLSIADNGTYHAVWFSNSSTRQGLFYASSKNSGQSFSSPINFGNAGASHPHVLALGQQVAVVWQEFDGKNNGIQVIKSADAGTSWTKPEALVQIADMLDEPFLVSDGQKIYLSWHGQQHDYQLKPIGQTTALHVGWGTN
ncbi:sialidase family protein [Methyloglobulus sp.]|uniref:sialidase family protein n=1 Tax=Methyloglobulus sp. TaxID=2518622 RepID=UPI00398904FD